MSHHFVALIPDDPNSRLPSERLAALETALSEICGTEETRIKDFGERLQFIDCGDNLQAVRCPSCRAVADLQWWGHRMDHAWDTDQGFHMCQFEMPCCGVSQQLDTLEYEPTQGFAKWFVSARRDGPSPVTASERTRLSDIAGQPLRFVHQSYA